jgi:HSP20 family molecular chaperone IbpA
MANDSNKDLLNNLREGISDIGARMNRALEEWGTDSPVPEHGDVLILADIFETQTAYWVVLELPGVAKERVKVRVNDGLLTIKGIKEPELVLEVQKYHTQGRRFGEFVRMFPLPEKVDVDQGIKAKFDQGLLTITFALRQP